MSFIIGLSISIMAILYVVVSAVAYRFRGAASSDFGLPSIGSQAKRGIVTLLLWLPFVVLVPPSTGVAMTAFALIGIVATFGAVALGHGDWMDFGRGKPDRSEWANPVLDLVFSTGNGPSRDAAGMALKGIAMTLPLALVGMVTLHPIAMLAVVIGAVGVPASYWLAWEAWTVDRLPRLPVCRDATDFAEYLVGVVLGITGLFVALLSV